MSTTAPESSARPLSIAGRQYADLSALLGAVVWLAAVLVGELSVVERALALAPLVLVPLGISMASTPSFEGVAGRLFTAAVLLQPLGALAVVGSFLDGWTPATAAALASPWLLVTGLLGTVAVVRTNQRDGWRLSETVIDAGFAYSIVGAVALLLHHLGVTLWFRPIIILLTAVHFHYAGFVLPVATGLVGRCADVSADTIYRLVAGVVLVGPALIAVGISFSPVLELLAVGAFTAGVAVLGGYVIVRVAPTRPMGQGVLLSLSAVALPLSMLLALAYGVGAFTGNQLLGLHISQMVRLHGSLNAYGFGLGAMLGWWLAVPAR